MKILPISQKILIKARKLSVVKKFNKSVALLSQNPRHPSLKTELLAPKKHGIWSFRINLKVRGLFIYHQDKNAIEIINITVHYH